ncbi:MAG: ABC transporter ATP-binding protein [Oscillospiraceae bacterium]|nr:ABC transporter ATP-binding protein [Oscillospiraceae bacterium]
MTIEYENIAVRLGGKDILTGTTLHSHENKIVGIVGANGCGKSTLIKTTFGIVPYHAGEIRIDGKSIREFTPRELAAMIGYVGQEASCAFDFSVTDVVAMGLFARRDKSKQHKKEIVAAALEELGISQFADRSIQRLSGGERKMVFIARAVAQGADMFILDEPTNHLDISHQLFVMDYLKKAGKTTLIVIHDLRLATHYCDYLYMLSDGVVFAEGPPLEVLKCENVRHVFGVHGFAGVSTQGVLDFSLFECGELGCISEIHEVHEHEVHKDHAAYSAHDSETIS